MTRTLFAFLAVGTLLLPIAAQVGAGALGYCGCGHQHLLDCCCLSKRHPAPGPNQSAPAEHCDLDSGSAPAGAGTLLAPVKNPLDLRLALGVFTAASALPDLHAGGRRRHQNAAAHASPTRDCAHPPPRTFRIA